MEIQLVADTNLFFECKVLEHLPWQELSHDPVVILLTKPVLDEIDKHKKASGRTRARALEIFGRVRALLGSTERETEIRTAEPKVILRLMPNVKPDSSYKEDLDYTKTDERLIGIVSTLNAGASAQKVILFTDDTGPATTADGLGLPYLMINESWRRPPSESTEEKKIKDLQKDLAVYRDQEPQIIIRRCEGADKIGVVEVLRKVVTPLTEIECDEILAKLVLKHPLFTDFVPPPPLNRASLDGIVTKIEYLPPQESKILAYSNVSYPQWLDKCRDVLKNLHQDCDEPEFPITLRWAMQNGGTRPALNVRIDFEAKGQLELIRIVDYDEVKGEGELTSSSPGQPSSVLPARFPSPPKPPAFLESVTHIPPPETAKRERGFDSSTLQATRGLFDANRDMERTLSGLDLAGFDRLSQQIQGLKTVAEAGGLFGRNSQLLDVAGINSVLDPSPFSVMSTHSIMNNMIARPFVPDAHNSEEFYYDGWPANRSVKRGSLTCDRWRHQTGEEPFEFDVLFTSEGNASGVVECTVHAENLTKPEQAKIVVRRKTKKVSILEIAEKMVEACS